MNLYQMKLVTVICEALAREPLIVLIEDAGAHGYTLFSVEGKGAKGNRPGDIAEFGNIQLEVILTDASAEKLVDRLAADFFPRFAAVAYVSDVTVLRPQKF